MPTYRYQCQRCMGELEIWQSMQDDALTIHDHCGGSLLKIYRQVRTLGIGTHGERYKEVEAREARWAADMPAYKRFRDRGYQPPQIDGCDKLEATAKNAIEVSTGGKVKVDEQMYREAKAQAEDIMAGRI